MLFLNIILEKWRWDDGTHQVQIDKITKELKTLQIREAELPEELITIHIIQASIIKAYALWDNKRGGADMLHTNQ